MIFVPLTFFAFVCYKGLTLYDTPHDKVIALAFFAADLFISGVWNIVWLERERIRIHQADQQRARG